MSILSFFFLFLHFSKRSATDHARTEPFGLDASVIVGIHCHSMRAYIQYSCSQIQISIFYRFIQVKILSCVDVNREWPPITFIHMVIFGFLMDARSLLNKSEFDISPKKKKKRGKIRSTDSISSRRNAVEKTDPSWLRFDWEVDWWCAMRRAQAQKSLFMYIFPKCHWIRYYQNIYDVNVSGHLVAAIGGIDSNTQTRYQTAEIIILLVNFMYAFVIVPKKEKWNRVNSNN